MKTALNILAIIIAGLATAAVAAVVVITLIIDPNDFKPKIEQIAADQGYPIAIDGDLSWRFFPNIAFSLGATRLLGAEQLISIEGAHTSVALMPLLRKQIIIDEVALDGLKLNLVVDADGKGNWQALIPEETSEPDTQEPTTGNSAGNNEAATSEPNSLSLDISRISLNRASIHYQDQSLGQELTLNPLDLTVENLNTQSKPFPVTLSWTLATNLADLPQGLTNSGDLALQLAINSDFSRAAITDGILTLGLATPADHQTLALMFNLDAANLSASPELDGALQLNTFNAKALAQLLGIEIDTQAPKALTQVALSAAIKGSAEDLSINDVKLQLDDSTFTGSFRSRNMNRFDAALTGDKLNLDNYLPPSTAQAAASEPENPAPIDETSNPFAVLADYQASLSFALGELKASGLSLSDIQLQGELTDGLLNISPIQTKLQGQTLTASAQVSADGELQGQANLPPINARALLTQLQIELPEMADNSTLTKAGFNLGFKGTLEDLTVNPLAITLDETTINGQARVRDFNSVDAVIKGDQLNLDRYLAPVDPNPPAEASEPTAPSTEPVDFSALQDYAGTLDLQWQSLIANQLQFNNLKLQAKSAKGVAELQNFQTDFYQGQLKAAGKLDTQATPAKITVTGSGNKVAINPLLDALQLEQGFKLAGIADTAFNITTQGDNVASWMEQLNGELTADTQAMQLIPINLEKFACQALSLIQGQSTKDITWPEETDLQNLKTRIRIANQKATIETLVAGVEQLQVLAEGSVNLAAQTLDVSMPFAITKPLTEKPGCPATSDWLLGKTLSLIRCKGTLLDPVEACGLDKRALREAISDYAEAKLKKRIEPAKEALDEKKEALDEKKDELKDDIKDKFNDEIRDSDLLKDLFKKKKKD